VVTWAAMLHIGAGMPASASPGGLDSLCTIMYTSGTTGDPKGVEVTHRCVMTGMHGLARLLKATKLEIGCVAPCGCCHTSFSNAVQIRETNTTTLCTNMMLLCKDSMHFRLRVRRAGVVFTLCIGSTGTGTFSFLSCLWHTCLTEWWKSIALRGLPALATGKALQRRC
jgi:acyl-CoA synthetase (AMP-forming)/AMP-acid ligase II